MEEIVVRWCCEIILKIYIIIVGLYFVLYSKINDMFIKLLKINL